MKTAEQKDTMPGLKQFWYPWPYLEGLMIEEATNEQAFIATGMYGRTSTRAIARWSTRTYFLESPPSAGQPRFGQTTGPASTAFGRM